jgi:hypothetical protein
MLDTLFDIAFWCPVPLALAVYFFTGRRLQRPRSLTIFDCATVALVFLLPLGFFCWAIPRQAPEDRQWMPLLIPMWTAFIDVVFLITAAAIRKSRFSKPKSQVARVA